MVNSLGIVILLMVLFPIAFGTDPCAQYEEIDEPLRSTGYIVKDKVYEQLLCDRVSIVAGTWYRFVNSAQLPTSCVQEYHCGTNIPLWMNGAHPQPGDGIVSRQVCGIGAGGGNCCSYQDTVRVKNCGTFYVYELMPARACFMAYCAGTGVPCPPSMYSPTGNGTGCVEAFPKLLLSPKLSNPIVKSDTFEFNCTVDFDPSRSDVGFDVEWLFDGHTDPKVPKAILGGTSRVTSMDQKYLEGHLGESVSCKVRSYLLKSPQRKGPFVSSNSYWCGIKMSEPRLEVGENEKPRQVQLISTIPLVCSKMTQASCKLEIYLEPNDHDMKLTTQCTQVLNTSSWDPVKHEAAVNFSVIAKRDFKKDGNKILELNFQEIFSADAPPIFNNYHIPFLQITTKDKPTAMCWCTGDPHCSTFDTQSTNKVQVRTWKCGAVSCNCAVAAREGNDIVIIDICQGTYGHTFPHLYIPHRGQMSQGTVVYQNKAGTEWLIDFPSGAQVKVDLVPNVALNIYVTVPEDDYQHTEGLCGFFDNNRDNDLKRPDGITDQFPIAVTTLENFTDSWRIPIGSSMFDLKEDIQLDMQYNNNLYFCNCDQKKPIVDCTIDNKADTPAVGSGMIAVVQGGQIISAVAVQGRRRQAESNIMDDDVPPNYFFDYGYLFVPQLVTYPTASGKTKAQAEKLCTDAFTKNDAIQKCVSVGALSLGNFLEMCVEDFKYFEEGAFVHTAKQAAIRSCSETILKDPAFHDSNGNPPAFITSDLCLSDCSDHGTCIRGVCNCSSGFAGDGCEIDTRQPPQLFNLISTDRLGTPMCDIRKRQCQTAFISGNNFLNESRLSCKVKELTFNGTTFHQTNKTQTAGALYRTTFNVGCKLPTKVSNGGETVVGYTISMTNDGHVYSNELIMNRIDSLCLTCHMDSGSSYCNIKIHTCLIEDRCYVKGALNPANPQQKCDPERTTTYWTTLTASTNAQSSTSTTRPIAPLGGSIDTRFDIWTDSKTGCQCKGDLTRRNTCACCEAGGCQCPAPNQFQCSICANMSTCGNPQSVPEMGIDGYTQAMIDCPCNFDKNLFICACCQNAGCQCSRQHKNQCADCNHMDQCGSKPWIFGPPMPEQ